jgi:hypothetical protein
VTTIGKTFANRIRPAALTEIVTIMGGISVVQMMAPNQRCVLDPIGLTMWV